MLAQSLKSPRHAIKWHAWDGNIPSVLGVDENEDSVTLGGSQVESCELVIGAVSLRAAPRDDGVDELLHFDSPTLVKVEQSDEGVDLRKQRRTG